MHLWIFLLILSYYVNFSRCLPPKQVPIDQISPLGDAIRLALRENEIIGDVLDDFDPSYRIMLAYPKYHERVTLGNFLSEKVVKKRPAFQFQYLDLPMNPPDNSTFTLILTDPDATSRDNPEMSEMCHWIITNLTLPDFFETKDSFALLKSKDGELKSYYPPAPPKGTGRHRYVFVLLKGDSSRTPKAPKKRPHWGYGKVRHGVRDWAAENELEVVGANFFVSQHGS